MAWFCAFPALQLHGYFRATGNSESMVLREYSPDVKYMDIGCGIKGDFLDEESHGAT